MTSDDERAFLNAIRAKPEDDLPRLVLADWLDDHERGEYAEFIRVQVELAAFPLCPLSHFPNEFAGGMCGPCQSACGPLRVREQNLLDGDYGRNWRHWAGVACELIPDGATYTSHITFRRGFVESVRCAAASWLANGDAILSENPVRMVTLTTLPYRIEIGRMLGLIVVLTDESSGEELPKQEDYSTADGVAKKRLVERYPGVTFTLPPPPERFAESREAGRRAAMEREQRVLGAFLS